MNPFNPLYMYMQLDCGEHLWLWGTEWILTDFPIVCFGPTVISSLPELPSRNEMLCLTYTGIATKLKRQNIDKDRHSKIYMDIF